MSSIVRNSAELSIDNEILSQAQELDIDLSRAAESGILQAIKDERERRWRTENAAAIEAYNNYIEKNGLPLEEHRAF